MDCNHVDSPILTYNMAHTHRRLLQWLTRRRINSSYHGVHHLDARNMQTWKASALNHCMYFTSGKYVCITPEVIVRRR